MGRRRIRISAVGAHKPIHHEFEHTGRVIPMHGTNNHDAVGRDPSRVDFVHPILRLSEVMIGITTAGPALRVRGLFRWSSYACQAISASRSMLSFSTTNAGS